jgi:hypothetical protein
MFRTAECWPRNGGTISQATFKKVSSYHHYVPQDTCTVSGWSVLLAHCILLFNFALALHSIIQPPGSTEGLFPHTLVTCMPSLPLLHHIEFRQICLLCNKYWKTGAQGKAEIYKTMSVQVPRPAVEKRAKGAATMSGGMATGMDYEGPNEGELNLNDSDFNELDLNSDDLDFNDKMSNIMVDTVYYESLSLGPSFCDFFNKGYSSILVRKEYHDMFQHISNLKERHKCGVVVTGMPGIGENIIQLL